MPVEFYCSQCEAFLRAPDSKAGLSITCPHCTKRCWVPLESEEETFSEEDEDWISEDDFDETDYESDSGPAYVPVLAPKRRRIETRCEACDSVLSLGEKICSECEHHVGTPIFHEPDSVDAGKILSDSWRLYTKHFGSCLAVTVADTVLTIIASVLAIFVGAIASLAAGNQPGLVLLMFFAASGLGWGIAMSMFAIGHMRFYLDLCRTGKAEIRKSLDFQGPIGHVFVGGVVYWGLFMTLLGPILLWPFGRVAVDQELSAPRALWTAFRLSAKHFAVSVVLLVIKIGALLVSSLFPVGGAILMTPFFAILNTVAYLHFIGELE